MHRYVSLLLLSLALYGFADPFFEMCPTEAFAFQAAPTLTTKWEYAALFQKELIKFKNNTVVGLDRTVGDVTRSLWVFGAEGWELIAVVPGETGGATQYYFKRPAGSGLPPFPQVEQLPADGKF